MTSNDEKLQRLVAQLQKAVIRTELHRGRAERRKPAPGVNRPRAA